MQTYLRITVDADCDAASAIDAVTRALGADRMRLPAPGEPHRSVIQDDTGRTIGTLAIYTAQTRKD